MLPEEIIAEILEHGFNSSHSVLAHDDSEYFRSSTGWIFVYKRHRGSIQIALEPVIRDFDSRNADDLAAEFDISWDEFTRQIPASSISFVSVGKKFADILSTRGFRIFRIGKEPWMDTDKSMPSGNSGRGVRSARNQAVRNGVTVREWNADDITADPDKQKILKDLHREWKDANILNISGFILATDPAAPLPFRRWFIAECDGEVEGYIVATRVGHTDRYYIEDLVYNRYTHKGVAELLITEALNALHKSGFRHASLGVVLDLEGENLKPESSTRTARLFFTVVSRLFPYFYNCKGQEVFRKRFKPAWEDTFLAVHTGEDRLSFTKLFSVLRSTLASFNVGISLSLTSILFIIRDFIYRYAITISLGVTMAILFAAINRGGVLPKWAYEYFRFSPDHQIFTGIYRNFVGNLLYETPARFIGVWLAFIFFSLHSEIRWKKRYLLLLIIPCMLFDNYISYFSIYKHFEGMHHDLYAKIMSAPLFGMEHYIAGLAGMIIWEFKKRKDILLSVVSMILILFIVWHSENVAGLILDLGVMIFFTLGSIIGRLRYYAESSRTRKSAKWKTPEMNPQ